MIRRYPFFAEQSASDCGVACLVMVSRYWGKQFSINRLRDRRSQSNLLKNQLAVALATQRQQNQAQELEKQVQIDQARQSYQTIMNPYNLQKEEKLAQVDQAKMTLDYNQDVIKIAESSLASAQKEVKRFRKLTHEGIVSEIQVVYKEDIAKKNAGLLILFLTPLRNYNREESSYKIKY